MKRAAAFCWALAVDLPRCWLLALRCWWDAHRGGWWLLWRLLNIAFPLTPKETPCGT